MRFEVKKHSKEEFYEQFCKFLDSHNFPRINKDVLPQNIFVAYNEDGFACYSIWYYHTDSKLDWLAFPASNKNINYNKRKGALDFLIEYVSNYAKKKGVITLFTTSGTDSVIKSLLNNNFELGDSNISHYTRKL